MIQGLSVTEFTDPEQTPVPQALESLDIPAMVSATYPHVDPLLVTDTLGVIVDVNPQMCEMMSGTRESLIGKPFKGHFTDSERAEDAIRRVLSEERLNDYLLCLSSSPTDNPSFVSFNVTTYRDSDNKLKGVLVSGREVSERIRLENEFRQGQQYTRGLIEASFDALLTIDPQLQIIDVNEQTARMTGFSRDELLGSFFPGYFSDTDLAAAGVAKALAEGFINDYVLKLDSKTGGERLMTFNASVYRDTEGTVRGIFAAGRDITEQTRLEEELRQAQNYTRGLIEASIDPIFTVDADLTITDVNDHMVRLAEVPKEVLVGSRFDDLFTEPDRAAAGVRETLRESSVTNYQLILRKPNGREVPVSFNASIFKDTAGKVRGIFAVARDVTEQRQLEHDLEEQHNYTRGLIEAVVDALITLDPQGRITDVNEPMVRLTGHTKKNLLGHFFADFFSEPERARAGIKQTLQTGVVKNYELVVKTKRGGLSPVSFDASVFRDTGGRVAGIFASARDTSEQIHLQQKLVDQQAYTRGLIESNIDAIITTDLLGVITDVNLQMCTVTGCQVSDLVGTPFKDYFTDPQRAEDAIRKVLAEDRVTNYELIIRGRDGKETLVSCNATTFMGEDGKLRGVFAAARDITEQKQLQQELQRKNVELEEQNRRVHEASRLKSEFLANMSHELRTPLNGIIGFSELMHDGKVGPVSDDHKEYLGDILASTRHLQQLINDILDLAKVESGKMEFRPEPVNLGKLVGEVRDILRTLSAKKRIQIATEVGPELDEIVLDPSKLKQVLYNYLSNAIKFTPDEGRIVIRACPDGPTDFRLEVQDTGIGIREQDFSRLFVEFQQLDASSAKKYQGTGLGLSLTRSIVEAQGGQVGVASQWGQGSTFYAVLPRDGSSDKIVADTSPMIRQLGQLTVLVVEDERHDRSWVVEPLIAAGYAVETAASGDAALRAAQRTHFDAITLDLLLPDMSGWDVLRAIRASNQNRDVPAIILTVVAESGSGLGFVIQDFLTKPVQADKLLDALSRVRLGSGEHSVLVIDDDPIATKLMTIALKDEGFQVTTARDGAAGLLAMEAHPHAVVILDLMMPGLDGFGFIHQFRLTELGRTTPVIVWTDMDLSAADRLRLQASAQAIVVKGAGASQTLISELRTHVGRSKRSTDGQ